MTTKESPGPPWTILSTLQWTADYFKKRSIESPRAAAEILLAHSLGCRRLDLYLRYDQPLNDEELTRYKVFIKRRISREPIAYIIGEKEFWSLDFTVNPSVLIPRPETEGLVEAALEHLALLEKETGMNTGPRRIIELGAGSGAVVVSLAHERPQNAYWATDCSLPAIELARENARRHLPENTVHFFTGRWFAPVNPDKSRFDIIISNPPYIPSGNITMLDPEIQNNEPRLALDGGPDGLRDIAHLIQNAPDYLAPGGVLLLEIGWDQYTTVAEFGYKTGAYKHIEGRKDYAGLDRIAILSAFA